MEHGRAGGYGRPYGQMKRRYIGYMEYANGRGIPETLEDLFNHARAVDATVEPLLNIAPTGEDSLTMYHAMMFLSEEMPDNIADAVKSRSVEAVEYEADRAERAIADALDVLSKMPQEINNRAVGAILTVRSDIERIRGLAEEGRWE